MVILIIMEGFFPGKKYGGPPVSVDNFCSLFKSVGHECYVVSRNHDMNDPTPYEGIRDKVWINRGNALVMYLSDKNFNKRGFETIINDIEPDVLYLQGMFQSSIIPCLSLSRRHRIGVLLAPRGELCLGAFKKKYKKIPYLLFVRTFGLLNNVIFQSTSDEETESILNLLHAKRQSVRYLPNIPSLPKSEYSHSFKKNNEARFIYLSRIHPKKNLLKAIKYLKQATGSIVFDIYGSIEDEVYWRLCQEEILLLPKTTVVNYRGNIEHDNVHEVFSKYDAFLFPTASENYGHAIAESLFAGTPVITSNNTPWKNLYANNSGWDLPLDDDKSFIRAIQTVIDMKNDEYQLLTNSSKEFAYHMTNINMLKINYENTLNDIKNLLK